MNVISCMTEILLHGKLIKHISLICLLCEIIMKTVPLITIAPIEHRVQILYTIQKKRKVNAIILHYRKINIYRKHDRTTNSSPF